MFNMAMPGATVTTNGTADVRSAMNVNNNMNNQQQQQQQQIQLQLQLMARQTQQSREAVASLPSRQQTNRANQSITSVSILSHKLHEITQQYSQEYASAYMWLPPVYKFILDNTIVFRFQERAKSAGERGEFTAETSFYLDKLRNLSPDLAKRYHNLVGLKCAFCNGSKEYIAGCTSFIEVNWDESARLTFHGIQSRVRHAAICRYVNPQEREYLRRFDAHQTAGDKKNLVSFIEQWIAIVERRFSWAPSRRQPSPLIEIRRLLKEFEVTEDSIYDDLVSSLTRCKNLEHGVFDDLSEHMNEMTTPIFETFLQNYQIRVSEHSKVELQCLHCYKSGSSHHKERPGTFCIDGLLNDSVDYVEISNGAWGFVTKHCVKCSHVPDCVKRPFRKHLPEQPMQNFVVFFKKLKTRLQTSQIWKKISVSPKYDYMHDVYLPVPFEKLNSCGSPPFTIDEKQFHHCSTLADRDNDIVMGEQFRNFEGNRRFRQLVSENRGLFLSLPPNQQEAVVESIISLIERRGGLFYTADLNLANREKCEIYTQKALLNGFPGMLRPAMSEQAASKVVDVECGPEKGVVHGYVQWTQISASKSRTVIIDPETGAIKFDSQQGSANENQYEATSAADLTTGRPDKLPRTSVAPVGNVSEGKACANETQAAAEIIDLT